jgi:LSD1 subclass zinc finger protein
MFVVNCAGCDQLLRLPDDAAGQTIRCVKCKAIILIPENPNTGDEPSYSSLAETTAYVEKKQRK